MRSHVRPAIVSLILLTLITGVLYPLAVTGVAKLAFPQQAEGSLMYRHGRAVGSALIGQPFSGPGYFWSRPSATTPVPYAADNSAGSNLAPSNPALVELVKQRIAALHAADPHNKLPIPVDLVTASASGLDPDISIAAAQYQLARVARARHMTQQQLQSLVAQYTEGRTFGVLGEPRVNVLKLNLALDARS